MRLFLVFISLLAIYGSSLDRQSVLKHVESGKPLSTIEGIGDLFIINLDKRPEKYESCLAECSKYNINPKRFSAVEGKSLNKETIDILGMVFLPHMKKGPIKPNPLENLTRKANNQDEGKPCFFYHLTAGAVGCYLSHLSLVNYLLHSDYNAIWVLEDDFIFLKDPKQIQQSMEDLDRLVGRENWDILFTDDEHFFSYEGDYDYYRPDFCDILEDFFIDNFVNVNDSKSPATFASEVEKLEKAHLLKWANVNRKGFICSRYPDYFERFRRISGRFMIHSMIVKKSAAQKIIDFYLKRGIFLPYDDELAFIPQLRMYNLKIPITSHKEEISDTNR